MAYSLAALALLSAVTTVAAAAVNVTIAPNITAGVAIAPNTTAVLNDGGFKLTCFGWVLTGTNFAANCYKANGDIEISDVNLNSCLINNNGGIYCQKNGNFGRSCENPYLSGSYLAAFCYNAKGGLELDQYDLNLCVGNHDGQLACLF